MTIRRTIAVGLILSCLFAASADKSQAKTKHAAPPKADVASKTPIEPSGKPAHLRIWKVSDDPASAAPTARFIQVGNAKAEPKPIAVQPGRYDFSGYADVPSGPAIVEFATADDKQFASPVRALIFLPPGGAATVFLHQVAGAALTADVIDDTAPAIGDLTVFNFLPASAGDCQIVMGDTLSAKLSTGTGRLRMRGLARQLFPVATTIKGADGRTTRWNNEIDFRAYRRASLVLWLDAYDRIRGRVFPDETAGMSPPIK